MKYTPEEIDEIVLALANEEWKTMLDMVEERAPEDVKIIKQHADVCSKILHFGVHRGWIAGAKYLTKDLIAKAYGDCE
jgi:hypothetical protein